MENLATKYRPKTFSDMVGQNSVALVLSRMVETDNVPNALLFSGLYGSGKTSAARILAAALNCTSEHKPCTTCSFCVAVESGSSLDVIEIDAASNGSVGDVRKLVDSLRFQYSGQRRVVILDEAHSLSREAFNALLKPLEEFPVTFILVTTEPEKVPDTVLSRLIEFPFSRIAPAAVFQRLLYVVEQEQVPQEKELLAYLASRSNGSMRDALSNLDLAVRAEITSVADFKDFLGESDQSSDLLYALLDGDHAKIFSTLSTILLVTNDAGKVSSLLTEALRDLLVLKAGGTVSVLGHEAKRRGDLATRLDTERILAALRLLWDLKTKIRNSPDIKVDFEIALVLISELFTRGRRVTEALKPTVSENSTQESPKLTLAEIQQRRKQ